VYCIPGWQFRQSLSPSSQLDHWLAPLIHWKLGTIDASHLHAAAVDHIGQPPPKPSRTAVPLVLLFVLPLKCVGESVQIDVANPNRASL
jgi:hypothetical protein